MKKLLVALAAVLVSAVTYGQGQVQFENITINGGNTTANQIKNPSGQPVDGTGRAQLYLNGAAIGPVVSFEPTLPGQFFGGTISLPGVAFGTKAVPLQVAAWMNASSFETATIKAMTGSGGIASATPTDISTPPDQPLNVIFQGFTLVPEPSTIALGILGAAALLFRRRK
jgi:hypothetical protein